ncbi:MAG: HAMP domain-containing histidine kinase, partial [Actinomycetota bacterium]|nr:HAMP domain-containing histidine kinase [Actinomycetota bacterium]
AAARRIAAGDLSARLPEPPPADRDELAELTRSINAMAAGLQRSRVLEQQFLLSVSHDLRTPLTSIRGYAEAIADGATEDTRQAAAVIAEQSARLARLVDDLLALARLDGRDFSLHVIDHDVRVPVGESVDAFGPAARQAGLEVALATGPVPVMVTADPVRVAQILGNLLENAAKYAGGRIAVTVGTDGPHAVLAVDDDGPGISPDDLSHVFERLYVARHRPVRAEVGSGLGLSIVSQLAAAMGGSATAGSSPGGGARIEVRLRRATSDAVATVVAPNATAGS